MSAAKHTPGPWEISPMHLQHGFSDNDGGVPIMAGTGDDRCRVGTACLTVQVKRGTAHKSTDPVRAANAALIAAAPDLLAAAKALLPADFDDHPNDFMPDWHTLRAAVSRADATEARKVTVRAG